MPSEDFTERILRMLSREDYRPQRLRALARTLGIAEDQYGSFRDTVKALAKAGRVVLGSRNMLMPPEPSGTIVGRYRANPRGFGFVVPELPTAHGDLYVPPGESRGAMTGDTVRARVLRKGKRGGRMVYEGRILEIVQRGQSRFVGELLNEFGRWFVRPDGTTFHGLIFVDDPGAKSARAGDQVVVEIVQFPRRGTDARGVLVQVLGPRGDAEVDLKSILWQYGYPEGFPEDVLNEARRAVADYDPQAGLAGREDLRGQTVVTIDPDDARDFDDAISLKHRKGGLVELGVHIADVSHFVVAGGPLDREARERSNSVYFPGFVIPMLPEVLSNGVCSLQETQPRLTKSAFITYDRDGNVRGARFANTLIESAKRLTYGQATAILDGQTDGFTPQVVKLLGDMDRLARAIRERRLREGMLVLDLPEVELVYDEDGNVTGAKPADTSFSHTIIEMFMVEANEAVARLLVDQQVPHLRRVHPEPDPATAENLQKFLKAVGLPVPASFDREAIQSLLGFVKGRPESFAVNLAILRSMQEAVYSPQLVGHYALASKHYAHFTSPIRRYPDLTVHRLLDAYVAGQFKSKTGRHDVPSSGDLEEIGTQCSTNERRAEDAEREYKLVKILQLLEKHLGDEYDGVVTGVTNFGVFVQLRELLIDGLLRFDQLPDDWWDVDAQRGCVVGETSGLRITIGQVVRVQIARVDVAARQLDLAVRDAAALGKPRARAASARQTGRKPPRRPVVQRKGKKRGKSPGGARKRRR
ncbi:MAG: ribonuclease R [Phycisphaerae bacterium]|nr:ribonuclease R [Phycisphaerae bacterium]